MRTLKISSLFLFVIFFNTSIQGQDIYDKLSRKLCKCLEKENVTNLEGLPKCFESTVLNNITEILEFHGVESISEMDGEALGGKIAAKLFKDCDYAIEMQANLEKEKKGEMVKQSDLTCDDLKSGDFYYVHERQNSNKVDTTHVSISNTMFLERMWNGRTYSLLDISWLDDCKFQLEFKESNDPFKKELSKPGDVYLYEVMSRSPDSIVIKAFWKEQEFQVVFFKAKTPIFGN